MKKRAKLFWIFAILFATSFGFANADSIAINSGGDTTISVDSGSNVEAFVFSDIPSITEEEVLAGQPASSGRGGGGTIIEPFTIDKTLVHQIIRPGEALRENLVIKNNKDISVSFQIKSDLKEFMVISEETFVLNAGEAKTVFIDFFAKTTEPPEAYTGKITITGSAVSKVVNVIIEVKERKPLFDVLVDILTSEVAPGENLKARFKVLNLGDLNNIDVVLYYAVKDYDDNIIAFREESIAIDKELNIVRKLNLPSDTHFGDYVLYLKARYNNITAASVETFSVVEKSAISVQTILIAAGIAFIIIASALFIILFRKFKKHENRKEKPAKSRRPRAKPEAKQKMHDSLRKENKKVEKELIKQKRQAEKRNAALVKKKRKLHKHELKVKHRIKKQMAREYAKRVKAQKNIEKKSGRKIAGKKSFKLKPGEKRSFSRIKTEIIEPVANAKIKKKGRVLENRLRKKLLSQVRKLK
jgi:large-conductance mechanosensitive channel